MTVPAPSPVVQHIASRPCRLCGGTEYSHFPSLGFEHVAGSSHHYFEALICRSCKNTDLFASLSEIERKNPHNVLRVPPGKV
jgi:hypothetical protein